MNGYEAYCMFMAVKRHFTDPNYDYFKYNGKIKTSEDAFGKRNDCFFFRKLGAVKDPFGFLIANFVNANNPKSLHVTELIRSEKAEAIYKEWKKRQSALEYLVKSELTLLERESFVVYSGNYPKLLDLYLSRKISIETIGVLNDILIFFPYWNKNINDQLIWPDIRMKVEKYVPFLEYEREQMKEIIDEAFR